MNNETYKTYPANPRYSISNYGNVRDTETGKKLEIGFTPTNKQFVRMAQHKKKALSTNYHLVF